MTSEPKKTTAKSSASSKSPAASKPSAAKSAAPKLPPKAAAAARTTTAAAASSPKEKKSAVAKPASLAYGTGRRKSSVARVWIRPGSGRITVNGRALEVYFARPVLRMIINQPFVAVDRIGSFDIDCTVAGGGLSGQAGAVRLGISRALDDVESAFHKPLRQGGFLTRDSRVVERKKYGHKKARRSFQFSKR